MFPVEATSPVEDNGMNRAPLSRLTRGRVKGSLKDNLACGAADVRLMDVTLPIWTEICHHLCMPRTVESYRQ